ncbi:MAG: hypothetical protein M5U01_39245 [Ardenticatenaceae bacterium]|nr:hypothetical protein [Ardenticatenaceae bacterium]HBY93987.1 hypothetical protein [Chloroflexota bacterium]
MALGQRASHIIKAKTGPDDPELLETLQEALSQVAVEDLIAVADDLAERHDRFVEGLGVPARIQRLTPHDWGWIARSSTVARRPATVLANSLAQLDMVPLVHELLFGDGPAAMRIATLTARLEGVDLRLRLELGTGLLHYTFPQDHWLWTRWLWDTTTQTGILSLLAGSTHNLQTNNVAEGYRNVGAVTSMSMRFAEGTGLLTPDLTAHPRRQLFTADVFLACAYSIYLYGITSWRLSREFNRLLPALPGMMRQLLGLTAGAGSC